MGKVFFFEFEFDWGGGPKKNNLLIRQIPQSNERKTKY